MCMSYPEEILDKPAKQQYGFKVVRVTIKSKKVDSMYNDHIWKPNVNHKAKNNKPKELKDKIIFTSWIRNEPVINSGIFHCFSRKESALSICRVLNSKYYYNKSVTFKVIKVVLSGRLFIGFDSIHALECIGGTRAKWNGKFIKNDKPKAVGCVYQI